MAYNNHHKSTSPITVIALISKILRIAEWFDWKESNPTPISMKINTRINIRPIIIFISLSLERLIRLSSWRMNGCCNPWVVIRHLLKWKLIREVSPLAILKRSLWVIFRRWLTNSLKHRSMFGKFGKRTDRM